MPQHPMESMNLTKKIPYDKGFCVRLQLLYPYDGCVISIVRIAKWHHRMCIGPSNYKHRIQVTMTGPATLSVIYKPCRLHENRRFICRPSSGTSNCRRNISLHRMMRPVMKRIRKLSKSRLA